MHKLRHRGSSPHARGLLLGAVRQAGRGGIIPARAGFTGPRRWCRSRWGDHPRTRGVYSSRAAASRLYHGSSPHARGLLGLEPITVRLSGIIPARAGFTPSAAWSPQAAPDHPRTRGVYFWDIPKTLMSVGSSPHARGLPRVVIESAFECRIIPARAGFTILVPAPERGNTDHPRTRGVYYITFNDFPKAEGSSPHARGLPTGLYKFDSGGRIIPARAGFTWSRSRWA